MKVIDISTKKERKKALATAQLKIKAFNAERIIMTTPTRYIAPSAYFIYITEEEILLY